MIKLLLVFSIFFLTASLIYTISLFLQNIPKKIKFKRKFLKKKDLPKISIASSVAAFLIITILTSKPLIALPFALISYFIPKFILKQINKRYLRKFNSQLLEGLRVISNSLTAGASLFQALEVLVKNSPKPLSTEFEKALNDVRLGKPMDIALEDMTKRIDSKELKMVITVINISRETGGNMAKILNRIAQTMTERNRIEGKINALTAQGKISGLIVGLMPFILLFLLYFIAPEMVTPMFTTPVGNLMLGLVVVLVAIGGFMINKIVSIDI